MAIRPSQPQYINPEDLAVHLGLPDVDERMVSYCAAAEQWVQRRRFRTAPDVLWEDPSVMQGAIMYAALLHVQRAQPQGLPGFNDSLGGYSEDMGLAMAQIYRLVGGPDPAVA